MTRHARAGTVRRLIRVNWSIVQTGYLDGVALAITMVGEGRLSVQNRVYKVGTNGNARNGCIVLPGACLSVCLVLPGACLVLPGACLVLPGACLVHQCIESRGVLWCAPPAAGGTIGALVVFDIGNVALVCQGHPHLGVAFVVLFVSERNGADDAVDVSPHDPLVGLPGEIAFHKKFQVFMEPVRATWVMVVVVVHHVHPCQWWL